MRHEEDQKRKDNLFDIFRKSLFDFFRKVYLISFVRSILISFAGYPAPVSSPHKVGNDDVMM